MGSAEFKRLREELKAVVHFMPKHKLGELRHIVTKAYESRFRRNQEPRYGSINRAFTESELQQFLRAVKNEKFRLLFRYQAFMGLRIGEVCVLHLNNIDFDKRELTLKTEKADKIDSLLIPLELFNETLSFLQKHGDEINASKGYIFYKESDHCGNGLPHVDFNYARKVFREALKQANLGSVYGYSEESMDSRRSRPLYRLTSHSLRHYAITRFAKSSNGNVVLSSRFARHSDPATTMRYIAKDKEQLYDQIENAFSLDQAKILKNRLSMHGT